MEVVGDGPVKEDDDSVSSIDGNETTTKVIVVEPITNADNNDEKKTKNENYSGNENHTNNENWIGEKMPAQTQIADEKESLLKDDVEDIELNGDVHHISTSDNGVNVKLINNDSVDPENESLSDDTGELDSFSATKLIITDVEYIDEEFDVNDDVTHETTFTTTNVTLDENVELIETKFELSENQAISNNTANSTAETNLSGNADDSNNNIKSVSLINDVKVNPHVSQTDVEIFNETENTSTEINSHHLFGAGNIPLGVNYDRTSNNQNNNNNVNVNMTCNGETIDLSARYSQQSSLDIPGKTNTTEETSFSTETTENIADIAVGLVEYTEEEEEEDIAVNEDEGVEEDEEEEPNENVRLMEGGGDYQTNINLNDDAEEEEGEEIDEESGELVRDVDSGSVISVWRGSLNIQMIDIPWLTDVDRVIDIQLGADQWGTEINQTEGELLLSDWGTEIHEIEKGEDVLETERDTWDTTINEMSTEENIHAEWNSEINDRMDVRGEQTDWSTTFNKIEKIDETKTTWRTIFRKIKEHVTSEAEWTTTFNDVEILKTDEEERIASDFSHPVKPETWETKFIKIDGCVNEDEPWPHTINEMELKNDDHATHWETKFISIESNTEEMNPWSTTFNTIGEPQKPNIWDTEFYSIASEVGLPQTWDTTFIDIEKHVADENEWTTVIEDRADMPGVPEDWDTLFKLIEEHASNPLWDTYFNKILPRDELLDRWEEFFHRTDLEDIERKEWETTFFQVEDVGVEEDWELEMNNIMVNSELPDEE